MNPKSSDNPTNSRYEKLATKVFGGVRYTVCFLWTVYTPTSTARRRCPRHHAIRRLLHTASSWGISVLTKTTDCRQLYSTSRSPTSFPHTVRSEKPKVFRATRPVAKDSNFIRMATPRCPVVLITYVLLRNLFTSQHQSTRCLPTGVYRRCCRSGGSHR